MVAYIDSFPGRELLLNNKKYLYFGGTAYLGLQTDPAFQKLFIQNINTYGTSYGASRKSNIQITIFEEVEAYLSQLVGSEACSTLSSGYLAGQFVVQQLSTRDYRLFYAPNTHSALFASKTKCYTTFATLNIALREHLSTKSTQIPVVFLDSIDFSGSNYPGFEALKSLPLDQIVLVVDDSHGIGIVGDSGAGVFRMVEALRPRELIVCCSLGKGFSVQAGAVFAKAKRIRQLTDSDFFGGASPASPASMATLLQAESIYLEKRRKLHDNIEVFLKQLKNPDFFLQMPSHPAFSYTGDPLTDYLRVHHIIVTSFAYPSEAATVMNRIILSAAHTKDDIDRLAEAINSFRE
ncbi:aminotransferase class I/II-fold pyridoxal phosphate-dependent enzyme [Flavobacteriaceae bacterium TP-CH-4]|uniref:Aminotransferase class I/II-fold pyridoxal phosphate-dependent enzyme n=1 Tax=Pelagihabitans pacificus TaxID=2696054 RepID=A0A967ASE2_9FLAO|nr:aminotransferase class I/II-fold pyridoxal phosphate-dependent enzyme [Pelagihabitans pacificus]NHF59504.1 aminotransferase class I/II-fold pyridoxal phosphate-dependent enzyme [Pelagihabitans pacificus]